MNPVDGVKIGTLVFVVAILQITIFNTIDVLGGTPDVLLVTLLCVALQRGSIAGAVAGFWGGLIVDTADLGTLGVTSLLLTIAGYWIGRYGETTGQRAHAPYLSVGVVTVLYALGALIVRFMLGDQVSGQAVLIDALAPGLLLNLVLTAPLYAVVRRLLPPLSTLDRTAEVSLLG